ncbi:MAG: hypothetical protein ACI4NO_02765 [Oxalobacter sp.]
MKRIVHILLFLLIGVGSAFAQNMDNRCTEIDRQYQKSLQKMKTADALHKMTVMFDNEDVNFGLIEKKLVFYYDNTQEEVNSNRLYLVRVERKELKSSIQEIRDYLFDPAYPSGKLILMNRDFSSPVYHIEKKAYSNGVKPFWMRTKQTEKATGKVVADTIQTKNIQDPFVQKQGNLLLKLFNSIANPEID